MTYSQNIQMWYWTAKDYVLNFFEHIPIIGGLVRPRWRDHWDVTGQIIFTLFFALLPSLLFGFYDYVITGETKCAISAIYKTIEHGELFMISASLLGPISYLALVDDKTIDPFPNRTSIIFTTMAILIFVSIGYIALNKSDATNASEAIEVSIWMLLITVFMVYLISVYKNARAPKLTEQTIRTQQEQKSETFITNWQNKIGEPEISFGGN